MRYSSYVDQGNKKWFLIFSTLNTDCTLLQFIGDKPSLTSIYDVDSSYVQSDYESIEGADYNDEYLLDDMVLTREQMDELFLPEHRRNAMTDPEALWPDKTVSVFVTNDFSKSEE